MANPAVVVEYVANLKQLHDATGKIGAEGTKTGALVKKGLIPATAALGALVVGTKRAIDSASALNEQQDAAVEVFGKSAGAVQAWAETLAESAGLSATEGLKAANAFGNVLSTVGVTGPALTDMSQSLVQLAGDMASFSDEDPSEMLERLRAGISGEAEPLRRFGVLLSEARVQQEAVRLGLVKQGEALTEQQKVQARYSIILADTTKQQGNFVKTGDSVANQNRKIAASTENASASFGQALLPAMQALQKVAIPLLVFLGKYPAILYALAAAIAVVAAAVVVLNIAAAAGVAITLPIAGIVLGIIVALAALVAVGILVYKNWDRIKAAAQATWGAITAGARTAFAWLKANWPKIIAILAGPLGIAALLIIKNWDKIRAGAKAAVDFIRAAFNGLVSFFSGLVHKVGDIFERIADAIRVPINAVVGAINALKIPSQNVTIPVPGPLPDIKFSTPALDMFPGDIPKLAAGGIVTRPTVALLGERGPEAVVPLGRGGAPAIVNVDTLIVREEADVRRIVAQLSAAVAVRL